MRDGRTGIFEDSNGALRLGVCENVNGHDSMDVKCSTPNGGVETVTVFRGQFHKIDNGNKDIANIIRTKFGIKLNSTRETRAAAFSEAKSFAEPSQAAISTKPTLAEAGISVLGETVVFGEAVIDAVRQLVRQIKNKKKVTGTYHFSKKATKKAAKKK